MSTSATRPHGTDATLIHHTAVVGARILGEPLNYDSAEPVRSWNVRPIEPYAQYPVSVTIYFQRPRERRQHYFTIYPNNLTYVTIERNGLVLYDSRTEVPCDMAAFEQSRDRDQEDWRKKDMAKLR